MAQPPGEIITLQLGGFANYVGAHYWNLQDELLGYASFPASDDAPSSSLASAMAAPAVLPAAAATVEPSVLFELREPARGGGGGFGGGGFGGGGTNATATTTTGRGLYAVPRVVSLDACGATGGVSFSADAAGRLGQGAAEGPANATAPSSSSSSSLHRAPPIPKSAFVRALEAQEILLRQLSLRNSGNAAASAAAATDPAAAARLEERQQRELEAAARALDEAAAEAGVALPGGSGGSGSGTQGNNNKAVRYWTDYLKVQLHPRSAVLIPGVWHGVHALDGYGGGGSASLASASGGGGGTGGGAGGALSGGAASEAREAAIDALRCWGEACDRLQGLQVFADDMTGFGALGAAVLREAADDLFPRRPVVYFSLRGPDRPGSAVVVGGGGRGGSSYEDDEEDDEFGLGKGTGRGAGSRIGGGGGERDGGGGGPAGARKRQLLSEALSAAEAACPEDGFATLYVPLAAPSSGSSSLPWLRLGGGSSSLSAAGAAYRSAALLAAAADTATLPSRVPSGAAAASLGPAVGAGVSLAELCRVLQARPTGGPSAPMAALGVALPCGAVGGGEKEDEAGGGGGDHRERRLQQPLPSFASSLYETLSLQTVASLTPGVRIGGKIGHSDDRLLSESVVLRGARDARTGAAAPLAAAAASLDAALLAERRAISGGDAWVQQRCVVAPPLAVPLPFPGLFSGRVTRDGCVELRAGAGGGGGGGGGGGAGGAGHHVASAPALTRLAATSAFSARLEAMAAALRPSTGGVGTLAAAWGYDGAELGELSERLVRMGGGGGGGDGD